MMQATTLEKAYRPVWGHADDVNVDQLLSRVRGWVPSGPDGPDDRGQAYPSQDDMAEWRDLAAVLTGDRPAAVFNYRPRQDERKQTGLAPHLPMPPELQALLAAAPDYGFHPRQLPVAHGWEATAVGEPWTLAQLQRQADDEGVSQHRPRMWLPQGMPEGLASGRIGRQDGKPGLLMKLPGSRGFHAEQGEIMGYPEENVDRWLQHPGELYLEYRDPRSLLRRVRDEWTGR